MRAQTSKPVCVSKGPKKWSRHNDRGMGEDDEAATIAYRIDNPVEKNGGFRN